MKQDSKTIIYFYFFVFLCSVLVATVRPKQGRWHN